MAPLAGTILTTSYQAEGAGYYAVEQTGVGFDFMFAHCMASSLAVSTGQAVTPGQALCKAGQTGDATAPHLDFEIWVGGWQAPGGEPIDPLPYLQAWEAAERQAGLRTRARRPPRRGGAQASSDRTSAAPKIGQRRDSSAGRAHD